MRTIFYLLAAIVLGVPCYGTVALASEGDFVPDEVINVIGTRPPPTDSLLWLFWIMDAHSHRGGGSDVAAASPAEKEQANDDCRESTPA
jgi:hypothetical protein